ncbi:hypothetical protein [uncultured Cyclobacterium sp.]|uniref:hypothetical protein n=1 Tax=uncultured Cyclobacterium sp. TaxID=453820 RepID=UPI0030ED2076|tara:strand:+ start:75195 stop:75605 length:411 start_codon:yes stop_codon:yes gene_type:complete
MKSKNIIYLLTFLVGALVLTILFQSLSQPGIKDLKGNYKEMAVYRNENNTGPVIRIFAVFTEGKDWEDMRAYGEYMPHTKYGNTKVFFFDQPIDDFDLSPNPPYFKEVFQESCIGSYEKTAMGQASFKKYPFIESN